MLLLFNLGSVAMGGLVLSYGVPRVLSGQAHFDNANYSPLWLAFDLYAFIGGLWSLLDSRLFSRRAMAAQSRFRRATYWSTAAPAILVGLVGVVAPLIAYLVVVIVFVVVAALTVKREIDYQGDIAVIRRAVDDVLDHRL